MINRRERATTGFVSISPAILHGGVSTVLALVPIAFSRTYGFIILFRLVSLIVLFGLFHGLLFLPVVLMLFGSDNIAIDDENFTGTAMRGKSSAVQNGVDNPDFKSEEGGKVAT